MSLLAESAIYLLAAIISVPISKRLGFGSVLGYLAAGIIIGPFGLRLISDPQHILHFAEFGVVFLLFVIGLELRPSRLWVLRRMVFGLGAAQVFVTAVALAGISLLFGMGTTASIVIGLTLALSSTAFVLQLLAEKKQLTTTHGRASFSILLFQDLAVIPLIAIMPMLGDRASGGDLDLTQTAFGALAIVGLILGGRLLLRPVMHIVAGAKIPELFTAMALLVVIGAALIMEFAGLSMVLGAFIAGMMLADSEYRHQLEADIGPFKGLFLGLFFIAVGMTVNLELLLDGPGRIATIVVALMLAKALVLVPLSRSFGICDAKSALRVAAVMSQGGEFAFVLFGIASREGILSAAITSELVLAVAVSMLLTPLIYLATEWYTNRLDKDVEPEYDQPDTDHNPVIIAGFGRVGQIIGRLLRIVKIPFTALDIDSSQVKLVRKYGSQVHYGDATRVDMLRAAGADHAKLFVIATGNIETSMKIAETVSRHYPHLKIVARARNRRHAHKLMDLQIKHIYRDTLLSSIAMSECVLADLGLSENEVSRVTEAFREHDEQLLAEQHAVHDSEEKLIQSSKDALAELESLLQDDLRR